MKASCLQKMFIFDLDFPPLLFNPRQQFIAGFVRNLQETIKACTYFKW